ncbi:uncharacterized protein LOC115737718 [Rhodamnia argentea]|uniref:E3 ubiquitin-protein ligase RMA n=1 Tax=Rhodamnia argentea TaxID=178133 RepID=A0A8B8NTL8_9MYRT|nr:uncharacterized protein LOC115737718 [Rhodamnia argentea]XP_030525871.1 uncharacterized protein LOC115737718 [Rhodamnia argentea]
MGEETSDTMNLDLNLGPVSDQEVEMSTQIAEFETWYEGQIRRMREASRMREARLRGRQRWRRRAARISPEARNISVDLDQLVIDSGNVTTLHTGEGSVPAEDRLGEGPKVCENNASFLIDAKSEKKDDMEKGGETEGSLFDCNICLDLARDPVVTCCGHLFCWPCLYQWLHIHSDVKECPVCKGEVTIKTVTPIYGRGNSTCRPEEDLTVKIPGRPNARRAESFRQAVQRSSPLHFPMEDIIRHLGGRFDLAQDLTQPPESSDIRETSRTVLNRLLTSRGMRREQNVIVPPVDDVHFLRDNIPNTDRSRRLSLLIRRSQSYRNATVPMEAYFRDHNLGRNEEQPPSVDDRDSFSSIAAVINSESQMDTAVEIDSMVSLSTSSSRRRGDASRTSDVDSGDSRATRRRRLD